MSVKRVTLTGSDFEEVEFDKLCGRYLVKNFAEDDIYVSFDEDATEDTSVKIPAGYFQEVIANEHLGGLDAYKTSSIYIEGTGEVEVQQLCYHSA